MGHSLPTDLDRLQPPIIGFVGYVGEWVDLDLVAWLARAKPTWSIMVIGPLHRPIAAYASISNLYFLGQKDYAELPSYLAACTVCIIPFVVNELTTAMDPVKLYEYLAAGKPVVATDLPELHAFGDACRVARSPQEFLRHVEAFVQEASTGARQSSLAARCRAIVREHDWERRVQEISRLLAACLNGEKA